VTSPNLINRRQLKDHQNDADETFENSFHTRRRTLSKNINIIRDPQKHYMSGIAHLLDKIDPVLLADHPENVTLWLPSNLPPSSRDESCIPELPSIEYRLRHAIAVNALQDIRRFRRFYQAIVTKTRSHISNTQKTRTNSQVDRIQQRIKQAAATYRASRSAISSLAPNEEFGPWKKSLLELHREDLRGPAREESETSQSRYVPSWIWQTSPQTSISADEDDFYAALRVEWCKAQERAARYEEEVELIVEEMRRTLTFFEWLVREWTNRATFAVTGVDNISTCGVSAYAHKQATVYHKLVKIFVSDWHECLSCQALGSSWLKKYPTPPPAKRHRLVSNVQLFHSTSSPPPSDNGELEWDPCVGNGGPNEPASCDDLFELVEN
jgi:hypothetical protein